MQNCVNQVCYRVNSPPMVPNYVVTQPGQTVMISQPNMQPVIRPQVQMMQPVVAQPRRTIVEPIYNVNLINGGVIKAKIVDGQLYEIPSPKPAAVKQTSTCINCQANSRAVQEDVEEQLNRELGPRQNTVKLPNGVILTRAANQNEMQSRSGTRNLISFDNSV